IHDIGALGRVVFQDGGRRAGFRIVVGGGLGPTPFVAQVLRDFVAPEDLLTTVRAVLQVFAEHGNRRLKSKARLKFVVHRLGIERFRALVDARLAVMTAAERDEAQIARWLPEGAAVEPFVFTADPAAEAGPAPSATAPVLEALGDGVVIVPASAVLPVADDPGFARFLS